MAVRGGDDGPHHHHHHAPRSWLRWLLMLVVVVLLGGTITPFYDDGPRTPLTATRGAIASHDPRPTGTDVRHRAARPTGGGVVSPADGTIPQPSPGSTQLPMADTTRACKEDRGCGPGIAALNVDSLCSMLRLHLSSTQGNFRLLPPSRGAAPVVTETWSESAARCAPTLKLAMNMTRRHAEAVDCCITDGPMTTCTGSWYRTGHSCPTVIASAVAFLDDGVKAAQLRGLSSLAALKKKFNRYFQDSGNAEDGVERLLPIASASGECLVHRSVAEGERLLALHEVLVQVIEGGRVLAFVGHSHARQTFVVAAATLLQMAGDGELQLDTSNAIEAQGLDDLVLRRKNGTAIAMYVSSITADPDDARRLLAVFPPGDTLMRLTVVIARGKWDLTMDTDAADVQEGIANVLVHIARWYRGAAAVDLRVYSPHFVHDGHMRRIGMKRSVIGRCATPERQLMLRDAVACGADRAQPDLVVLGATVTVVDVMAMTATPEARHLSDGHHYHASVTMNILALLGAPMTVTGPLQHRDDVSPPRYYTAPARMPPPGSPTVGGVTPKSASPKSGGAVLCDQCAMLEPERSVHASSRTYVGNWPCRVHRARLYETCFDPRATVNASAVLAGSTTSAVLAEPLSKRSSLFELREVLPGAFEITISRSESKDACVARALAERSKGAPHPRFDLR